MVRFDRERTVWFTLLYANRMPRDPSPLLSTFEEPKRTIAHHPLFIARRVTRIAKVEYCCAQPMSASCQVESIDKHAAAGLLAHEIRAAPNDRLRGRVVEYPGRTIGMIVAQVRADDDQRFWSIPELLDDRRDFRGRRIAGDNRHDRGR